MVKRADSGYQMTIRSSGGSHIGSPGSIPKARKKGSALRSGWVARTEPGACVPLRTSNSRNPGRIVFRQTEAAAMKKRCSGVNGGPIATGATGAALTAVDAPGASFKARTCARSSSAHQLARFPSASKYDPTRSKP